MNIIQAKSVEQIAEARKLFREYEDYLGVSLCFQDFEEELASLPGKYAAPDGGLFLAVHEGQTIGCGALRRLGSKEKNLCEMKRLYVRPEARGLGAGKKLAHRIVEEGARLGYSAMFLDTLERLKEAMSLYESMGFVRTESYYDNPLSGVVYLKIALT